MLTIKTRAIKGRRYEGPAGEEAVVMAKISLGRTELHEKNVGACLQRSCPLSKDFI
jgi:hypothetical protein